jgi:hypothetical protein
MRRTPVALATIACAFVLPATAGATPTANFNVAVKPAGQPTAFRFTGTCDRGPCTYRWSHPPEFATNVPQPRVLVTFTYVNPGSKSVELTVTNRRGQTASRTRAFTVPKSTTAPPPPPLDTDGDGTPNASDQCPSNPGPASNGGCPVPPPPPSGFPNASNTGVPAEWTPAHTTNGSLTITQNGSVIDGELVTGSIYIRAQNVTVRNSWVYGQIYNQASGVAYNGLLIEDTTLGPPSGIGSQTTGAIGVAGYTARRVKIINSREGFRIGGYGYSGNKAAGVTIEDSFVRLKGDSACSHYDGIQGYDEPPRQVIHHNTIDISGIGCSTGAIYVGNDNPSLITVTDNLLAGGSYTMRLQEGDATYDHVSGNRFVNTEWDYGPALVVNCGAIADWSDNSLVNVDSGYQVTSIVRALNTC